MEMKAVRLALLVLAAILVMPPDAGSSGPFLLVAQFGYQREPPPEMFARGEIGIIRKTYYRRYLVVAYRYLTGVPLNREEAAAFATWPTSAGVAHTPGTANSGADLWLLLRNQFPNLPPAQRVESYRRNLDPNAFVWYRNCLDDAFERATQTLADRQTRWGASSEKLAEWVRGQDDVFKNCQTGSAIPARLASGADPLLAADRRYQIAAAEFYSEQYPAAERDFRAIANEAGSPWQDLGLYMVARTLIREATVAGNTSKLQEAASALRDVRNTAALSRWHGAAQRLLTFVEARLDPQRRMAELGERLTQPGPAGAFDEALAELTFLWDTRSIGLPTQNDLTDWVEAFQGQNGTRAVDQWRRKRTGAWLIAALASIPGNHASAPELIAAARRVQPSSPAWPSATYYGILLQASRGEAGAAREWADRALRVRQPTELHNALFELRLKMAQSSDEFLQYGPRQPVAINYDYQDQPLTATPSRYGFAKRSPVFDSDFTTTLNETVPLARWIDAASSQRLPAALQADIAQAGWVRAVLLEQGSEAQLLAGRLATLRPALRVPLGAWLAEKNAERAKFAAVFLMLRIPGMQPVVRNGFGRVTSDSRIDDFRDNWWSLAQPAASQETVAAFLPELERTQGRAEWTRLRSFAAFGPDYLCERAIAWARAHPDDSRSPEALYLAVRSTRYPPAGARLRNYSKEAFTLLHERYPKAEWARRTPYWY
jgi:hypothetical protein